MKILKLSTALVLTGVLVSSCVYYTPPVADMPYKNNNTRTSYPNTWVAQPPVSPALPTAMTSPALPMGTAVGAPRTSSPGATIPTPAIVPAAGPTPVPTPAATPAPAPAPATKPLDLTKPSVTIVPEPAKPVVTPAAVTPPPAPKPVAAPAATPAPAAAAKPAASASNLSAATDPKEITNQGPIPVATRVEGDPTRVYNPLDPSKTIRVTDKTGKPYPSGKELKVRGTNFHFYVP